MLSTSGSSFIRLSNEFVFPNPEPPIINICIDGQEILAKMFFYVFFCNILSRLVILLHLISFFSFTRSLLFLYAYIATKSKACIVLSVSQYCLISILSALSGSKFLLLVQQLCYNACT